MLYSCKKCLKTFEKEIEKCTSCGGEIKQTLTKEYKREKRINYECPHCKHSYPFNFSICPKCGKKSNRCPYCGYNLFRNFWVCPGCGKKINNII